MAPLTAAEIDRDFVSDGIPSSGIHEVKKSDRRAWGSWVEQIISAFTSNGGLIYSSKALLDADLAKDANRMAWVLGDPVAANNGVYRKIGASGTGSWTRASDLPFSFIVAADAGAGTPNAIQATTTMPVSGSALVLLNIFEENTASPVTVSFNGGAALAVKSNSGNDIVAGGLQSGMLVMGRVSGSTFRLVSDQISTAIIAQMEGILSEALSDAQALVESAVAEFTTATQGLRDQAAAFADASAASATEAAMYAEMVGAAVYDFNFDTDPETPGLDWNE